MIDDLIDRLNQLCRKFVLEAEGFTEETEIRKVFKEIKDQGYRLYSEPCDINAINTDYLSDGGKAKHTKLMEVRQRKMQAISQREYERAADLRDVERNIEREVLLDYIKVDGVAYFKIHDRDGKEIICHLYAELLPRFFKIS